MIIIVKYENDIKEYKYNSFEVIKDYDSIIELDVKYYQLTKLPCLPNSLKYLYCYNYLTSLPELLNPNLRFYYDIKLIKKHKIKYLIKIIYL